MNKILIIVVSVLIAVLVTGCGKDNAYKAEVAAKAIGYRTALVNSEIVVRVSEADILFWDATKMVPMVDEKYLLGVYNDSAPLKRKHALNLGRQFVFYKFLNYQPSGDSNVAPQFLLAIKLDGVSNILYNTSYLCSVPHKLLRSGQFSTGFGDWILNVLCILLGGIISLIMLPVAPIIGTICHPLETFSNLIGGFSLWQSDDIALASREYLGSRWDYFCVTNLFASLWDLIWGAILLPILEAILFILGIFIGIVVIIVILGIAFSSKK